MNIIKTQITRTAEEITANGIFHLEYTVSDNVLERITATIRRTLPQEGVPEEYLGTIVYESPAVNLNFINTGRELSPLVVDFETLLGKIRTSLSADQPTAE